MAGTIDECAVQQVKDFDSQKLRCCKKSLEIDEMDEQEKFTELKAGFGPL